MTKVIVIAEAGVNHNGDINIAYKLVDAAKAAGADFVKFQTFNSASLVTKSAGQAEYQIKNLGEETSQYQMLKKLELSHENHYLLKAYCEKVGIDFLSTSFDMDSVEFLRKLGLKMWKIPSGEILNLPYVEQIISYGDPIIFSTGMASLEEIGEVLKVFDAKKFPKQKITILHCTTNYPAQMNEINLKAMKTIQDTYGVSVGYSDHSLGIEVAIAAVALGAKVIEKHFTIDRNLPGPDHLASLEPYELKQMVQSIRNIEVALGSANKSPNPIELENAKVVRKSIVAKKNIKKGEIFSTENLTTKRPGTGISPMRWHQILGTAASKDFKEDDLIS